LFIKLNSKKRIPLGILFIFARLKKNITKMKKIIVLIAVIFFGVAIFSACDTQHKCAAYGHYAYHQASETPAE